MPAVRASASRRAAALRTRVGEELRIARVTAGVSQREAASAAGLSQSAVCRMENGAGLTQLEALARLAAATGCDLSIRIYPASGVSLRDSGQLVLAELIRTAAAPAWRVRFEVPVGGEGDRRAADVVLAGATELLHVEIVRWLADLQAELRAGQLKRAELARREARPVRFVLAVADTRRHRALVRAHAALIRSALPADTKRVWRAIRSGDDLGADGILWLGAPPRPRRSKPADATGDSN